MIIPVMINNDGIITEKINGRIAALLLYVVLVSLFTKQQKFNRGSLNFYNYLKNILNYQKNKYQ